MRYWGEDVWKTKFKDTEIGLSHDKPKSKRKVLVTRVTKLVPR